MAAFESSIQTPECPDPFESTIKSIACCIVGAIKENETKN
jgi:hypothetical protein